MKSRKYLLAAVAVFVLLPIGTWFALAKLFPERGHRPPLKITRAYTPAFFVDNPVEEEKKTATEEPAKKELEEETVPPPDEVVFPPLPVPPELGFIPVPVVPVPIGFTANLTFDDDENTVTIAKWNGYTYEAVAAPGGITWRDAEAAARARGGYLAVIHSPEINDLIFKLINRPKYWSPDAPHRSANGPWFNAYGKQDSLQGVVPSAGNGLRPYNGWFWRTQIELDDTKANPPTMLTYFNWVDGGPNFQAGPDARGVHFYAPNPNERAPTWMDELPEKPAYAYVVEYPPFVYEKTPLLPATNAVPLQPGPPPRAAFQFDGHGRKIVVIEDIPRYEAVKNASTIEGRHRYQVYVAPDGITWYDASVAAMQLGGRLAVITDGQTNASLFALSNQRDLWRFISQANVSVGPWLGAWRQGSMAGYGAPAYRPFEWLSARNEDGSRAILDWVPDRRGFSFHPWAGGQPSRESLPPMQQGRRALCVLYMANGNNRTPTWGAVPWDVHAYSFIVETDL